MPTAAPEASRGGTLTRPSLTLALLPTFSPDPQPLLWHQQPAHGDSHVSLDLDHHRPTGSSTHPANSKSFYRSFNWVQSHTSSRYLNITLLSQGCILGQLLAARKASGIHSPRTGDRVGSIWLARVQLTHRQVVGSSRWPPPTEAYVISTYASEGNFSHWKFLSLLIIGEKKQIRHS